MQISRFYSNLPDILSPIGFNHGVNADRLNIVLGEVKHPKDRKKDSHNLGKTTLLQLIDFLMLKGWSQDSFLYKHRDRFAAFVFYLEIALNGGGYTKPSARAHNDLNLVVVRSLLWSDTGWRSEISMS